jgi:hypothetical protein
MEPTFNTPKFNLLVAVTVIPILWMDEVWPFASAFVFVATFVLFGLN